MNYLLIILSMQGSVEARHVTREQCYAAVDLFHRKDERGFPLAFCLPPNAKFSVEGMKGGSSDPHLSGGPEGWEAYALELRKREAVK